ncbi:hypothetical protein [Hydrogenophaga sp.]|uniref:hypothetical protein n=1 Tax=Hydrogenophaga sp. TaxID=1904254 RepID=UPI003F70E73A
MRPEQSGQATVVGWYGSGFVSMPLTGDLVLPRLAISCVIELPPDRVLDALTFEVLLNEKILHKVALPKQAIVDMDKALISVAPANASAKKIKTVQFAVQMSPFVTKEEGRLVVRVCLDDKDELIGNSLWFKRGSTQVVQKVPNRDSAGPA